MPIDDIPKAKAIRLAIIELAPRDNEGSLKNPYKHWVAMLEYAIRKNARGSGSRKGE